MSSIIEGIISIFDSIFGFKRPTSPKPHNIKFSDIGRDTPFYWSNDPNYDPPKSDYIWISKPKEK